MNYSQLFPIVLKIYFDLEENSEEEKKLVMKELETTLCFIFRLITVKGKSPGDIPRFVPSIIEEIAVNKKLFNSDLKKDWLEKEFSDDGRKKFYDELLTYSTKRNKIWEFVLKNYYSRKFQNILKFEAAESSTMDLKQVIYNWRKISVEHLVPQSILKQKNKEFEEDDIYSLGNVTLVEGSSNSRMSNSDWKVKKNEIKNYGKRCPLNWEENFLFNLDKLTSTDIKKRGEILINEFKNEMQLFDVLWVSTKKEN